MAYVSREKIIEHIEKFYDTVPLYTDERHLIAGLKAYIKNLPTADVVEVSCRCGKCKHYDKYYHQCTRAGRLITMRKNDFCSYGERK